MRDNELERGSTRNYQHVLVIEATCFPSHLHRCGGRYYAVLLIDGISSSAAIHCANNHGASVTKMMKIDSTDGIKAQPAARFAVHSSHCCEKLA